MTNRVSLVAQIIKNLPAVQETWIQYVGLWVQSLGPENPLEKEMATHSRILSWEIPQTEEAGGPPWGSQSCTRLKQLSTHIGKKEKFYSKFYSLLI